MKNKFMIAPLILNSLLLSAAIAAGVDPALEGLGASTSTTAQAPLSPSSGSASGVELASLDKMADPCGDFYQYACGHWMSRNPVPADQSRWGRFNELAERNRVVLRDILDQVTQPKVGRSANDQKIGD